MVIQREKITVLDGTGEDPECHHVGRPRSFRIDLHLHVAEHDGSWRGEGRGQKNLTRKSGCIEVDDPERDLVLILGGDQYVPAAY